MGLQDYSNLAQIASVAVTGLAIYFALIGPEKLAASQDHRKREDDERSRHSDREEVLHAVDRSVRAYIEGLEQVFRFVKSDDVSMLRRCAEEAERARRVLDILLDKRMLSDGIIRCAVDGAELARETAAATRLALQGTSAGWSALQLLKDAAGRARATYDAVEHLRHYHVVPRSRSADQPNIQHPLFVKILANHDLQMLTI